jgi:hypothetical protein
VVGLAPADGQTLVGFLEGHCFVDGESRISVAEGVLSSDDVDKSVDDMSVSAPYPRFRFAFVDDVPGANAKANGLRFWCETFAAMVKIDDANVVTDVTLD